jgi:diamine N-acetyltransferase
MVEIRLVQHKELPQLRKIAIETYIDTFAPFNSSENMELFLNEAYHPEQIEREWLEPGSVSYLAWENETPAGYARLRLSNEAENLLGTNTLELQRLYVHPAYKNRKVGASLMQKTREYATLHKFDWLWLGVWERNFKAQEFYAKWGFEKFGEHIFKMGNDDQIDWLLKVQLLHI